MSWEQKAGRKSASGGGGDRVIKLLLQWKKVMRVRTSFMCVFKVTERRKVCVCVCVIPLKTTEQTF